MWEESTKRTLGIRDKQILYERAKHQCEACGKTIDFTEMQVGHKIAASKGGHATLRNTVCLCYRCNKLQGTDSWSTFLKKMGKSSNISETKSVLKKMSIQQLKALAQKHGIKVKGTKEEGFFSDNYKAPSKTKYVNALSKLSMEQIQSTPVESPIKRKKKQSSGWLF